MEKVQTSDHQKILQTIYAWPADQQIDLTHELLKRAAGKTNAARKQDYFQEMLGLLATDEPPPTDEEVERILAEERMKKYS
ncbi:MAG TPA: hypothetical protein ENJ93_04425 [Chloroflexi bacterium]|nr:hypothetical protein [Chloroflexota bacterium]